MSPTGAANILGMSQPPQINIQSTGQGDVIQLRGDFSVLNLAALKGHNGTIARIDASGLTAFDTAGAQWLIENMLDQEPIPPIDGLSGERARLLDAVRDKIERAELAPQQDPPFFRELLARMGSATENAMLGFRQLLGFVGLTLSTAMLVITARRTLRVTAAVHHMERAGLDAVPIVALLSFLVGAVVAFLGATVLADFGAQIFTVELVSYSFMREFGVLLTAILIAGRSGSAFTAEIGMMKAREEIDAIRTLGMDPIELLVIPRMLALVVMMPILTLIAVAAGILGGALVGSFALDISPGLFLARVQETTPVRHLFVGLAKAPVFAALIALVGCLEGLKVQGTAESVGRHTTSAVVQSIFLVILVDAIFAIMLMELDL